MKKLFLLFGISFGLMACASYPESVRVPENTPLVSFDQASEASERHLKQQARWSGVIAETKNLADKTQLEVLYYPANSSGRPITKNEPVGRFRVYVEKFLDPAIYKQGKAITALGEVKEKESAKIGEFEYQYPTLESATVHLWPKQKPRTEVSVFYGWHGYHPSWYWHGGTRFIYVKQKGKNTGRDKPSSKDTPNP